MENNEKLKTIVNVYKIKLINADAPGLGDYLRGCLFLIKIAKELNYNFNMDMSHHPISNYLKNSLSNKKINYNNIYSYIDNNIDRHYEEPYSKNKYNFYMNSKEIFKQSKSNLITLFTNAFPVIDNMSDDECIFFKNNLEPNNEMNEYIENILKNLNLEKQNYSTIHIRIGDKYLTQNQELENVFLSKIIYAIKKIIVPHKNYIIISDSDKLKKHIYNLNISNIKIYFNVLEHVGQNIQNKPNGVKDCLLDFFLMANSNEIHLLKNYWWGSGFSYYCSKIYKIPYHSTDINSINLPINESKNPLVYKSIQKKEIFSIVMNPFIKKNSFINNLNKRKIKMIV